MMMMMMMLMLHGKLILQEVENSEMSELILITIRLFDETFTHAPVEGRGHWDSCSLSYWHKVVNVATSISA